MTSPLRKPGPSARAVSSAKILQLLDFFRRWRVFSGPFRSRGRPHGTGWARPFGGTVACGAGATAVDEVAQRIAIHGIDYRRHEIGDDLTQLLTKLTHAGSPRSRCREDLARSRALVKKKRSPAPHILHTSGEDRLRSEGTETPTTRAAAAFCRESQRLLNARSDGRTAVEDLHFAAIVAFNGSQDCGQA